MRALKALIYAAASSALVALGVGISAFLPKAPEGAQMSIEGLNHIKCDLHRENEPFACGVDVTIAQGSATWTEKAAIPGDHVEAIFKTMCGLDATNRPKAAGTPYESCETKQARLQGAAQAAQKQTEEKAAAPAATSAPAPAAPTKMATTTATKNPIENSEKAAAHLLDKTQTLAPAAKAEASKPQAKK